MTGRTNNTPTTHDAPALQKLIERFKQVYDSFDTAHYLEDERTYKLAAAARLRDLLSEERLRGAIERGDFAAAHADIRRAYTGNNLLNQWDVLPIVNAPVEALVRALYDLLYGSGPFERRFNTWVGVLSSQTPRVWPAATYFLMMHNPETDILVKPNPFKALLHNLGRAAEWPTRPDARSYRELIDLAQVLYQRLRPLGARDMIDVQSFIWIVRDDEDDELDDDTAEIDSLTAWQTSITSTHPFIQHIIHDYPAWLSATFDKQIAFRGNQKQRFSVLIDGRLRQYGRIKQDGGIYTWIAGLTADDLRLLQQLSTAEELRPRTRNGVAGHRFSISTDDDYALLQTVMRRIIEREQPGKQSLTVWLASVAYQNELVRTIVADYPGWLQQRFGAQIDLRPFQDRTEPGGLSVFYNGHLLQYLRLHKPDGLHVLLISPLAVVLTLLQEGLSDPATLRRDDFKTLAWAYKDGYRFVVKTSDDYALLKRVTESVVQPAHERSRRTSMARINGPHAAKIYDAAQRFVDAALRSDDSLFTPGKPIWTPEIIADLYERFVLRPDEGRSDFWTKLKGQLAGAPPDTYQLTAELLYIHYLPAWRSTVSGYNKRRTIQTVLDWSPQPVALPADLAGVLDDGLARMGQGFNQFKPSIVRFLVEFIRAWKRLSPTEQDRLLNDPWAFKQMLFAIPIYAAQSQREILLHLIHPDTFEAIASRDEKQKIDRAFAQYVSEPTDDIDRRIMQIRQRLSEQYGPDFNFYWQEVQDRWKNGGPPDPITPWPEWPFPSTLGRNLRSYVQLAIRLNDEAYTAEEIVALLGRISPTIVQLDSPPSADELVTDLMLFRLLEQLPDGRFRRWAHLADATEAHMLRYAALTYLLPNDDGSYMLPSTAVSLDGPLSPAEEWVDPTMAHWYAEAGLAELRADGWWVGHPDAFQPLDADTPTAHALNTFLAHLRRVREHDSPPPLPNDYDTLPILDPATLDERIAEIQRELLIDRPTVLRVYRSLIAGRHVILSGPPGTGKTHLARLLPKILWRDQHEIVELEMVTDPNLPPTTPPIERHHTRNGYDVEVVTATEDWGTRHVIGGIVPQLQQNGSGTTLVYRVRHGCLTRTVLQNYGGDGETLPDPATWSRSLIETNDYRYRGRWLVIDEFTRAPIDAAFGSLLTTLSGQRHPELSVPTDAGIDRTIPLPRDFRLIGTLNSFDRHFLNQISEAMKRRFTFIDVLPPGRTLAANEQALALYGALQTLKTHGVRPLDVDKEQGYATWPDVLDIRREETPLDPLARVRYVLDVHDAEAQAVLDSFWRLFEAIRIYRQLGTAQAETLYATLVAGRSIGMDWDEALDSALADVLADQLQVLARDEQRVLLALIEHAADLTVFTNRVQQILKDIPRPRQAGHLSQFKSAGVPSASDIDGNDSAKLQPEQLRDLFRFDLPLRLSAAGLFARRLYAFVNEKGL